MTTITALHARLNMDVSNFSEGANLARAEVNKVASVMRQSVPPTQKFQNDLDLLNRAFSETGKKSVEYANAVEFLNKKHKQGQYSAEAVAKAEAEVARQQKAAAEAAKRLKDETARLATEEKNRLATMERGKQVMLSVQTAQEAHNRRVREYSELLRKGAINQETYNRAVERSKQSIAQATTATGGLISSLKAAAVAYIGFQTVTKAINLSSQIEDATIAFETLTGSVEDGKKLFDQIRSFAEASPITFTNAAHATKTMLSFGMAAQDIQQNLRMLSDITGGNNERFKSLTLAFSQMSAAGRLMGQDLLQMINVGFNPLQQISKTTGETMVELKKRMEDGGISADEVRRAFEDATGAGGMFNGMTERLAGTVSGKLNIALSELEKKLAAAGKAMGPVILQALDAFNKIQPMLQVVIDVMGEFAQQWALVLAYAQDFISSVTSFSIDTTQLDKYFTELAEREMQAKADKEAGIAEEFKQKKAAVNEVAIAQRKAQQEQAKLAEEAAKAQKKAAEEAQKEQERNIKKQHAAKLKAIEDERKERERAAQQQQEQFHRDVATARKAALDFFRQKEEQQKQRRADVSRGPGSGIEAGSSEAAKFAADLVNKRIGDAAVPVDATPGEKQIVVKAAMLYDAQQKQNAIAADQLNTLAAILTEAKENGFRRIR